MMKRKFLSALWFVSGVVFGCLFQQFLLLIDFIPENGLLCLRLLGISCILLLGIWPFTVVFLLARGEKNVD